MRTPKKVNTPASLNLVKIVSKYVQKLVAKVIFDFIELKIKINLFNFPSC